MNLSVFVAIPAFVIFFGFTRINGVQEHQRDMIVEQKVEKQLSEFAEKSDAEAFLAQTFWKHFYKSQEKDVPRNFRELRKKLDDCFEFVLMGKDGKHIDSTVSPENFNGDWGLVLAAVEKSLSLKSEELKFSPEEEINFKRMFGPQAMPETLDECISEKNSLLVWPDVSRTRPCIWFGRSRNTRIFVFVASEFLKSNIGLEFYVKNFEHSDFSIGFGTGSSLVLSKPVENADRLKSMLKERLSLDRRGFSIGSDVYYQRQINDDLRIFVSYSKAMLTGATFLSAWSAALLFVLAMVPFVYLSFRSIVLNEKLRLSISFKLGFLFLFSGGLPLLILLFVGFDYLSQKEFGLYDEIHEKATRYLQNFDERFESECAHRIVLIQKALKEYTPILAKDGIVSDSYFKFVFELCRDVNSIDDLQIFMIASSSRIVGTERIIYDNGRIEKIPGIAEKRSSREEAKIYSSIGKYIIDSVNGKPVDGKVSTEVELLAESALQKSLYELQNEFVSTDGKIRAFGLGPRSSPAYVDLMPLFGRENHDYLLLIYWDPNILEKIYISRQFLNANRNMNNLKIYAASEAAGAFFPAELSKDRELRNYVAKFTQKPQPPRQFVEVNYRKYLIMGFKGTFMRSFSFFALYPADEVNNQIYSLKKMLVSACVLAVLIISLLGYLLVNSFLIPLQVISGGAQAIKNRDFDMRLPSLGNNEFGDIARIFNETMVDFEELKVAGIVQEQLLPGAALETASLKIFGKSMTIGDVGGDYFDYFTVDENNVGLMIGDVSGQGIGAALLMAMSRAVVLQSQELLKSPLQLMLRFHEMLLASGEAKEKRFMGLQYICFSQSDFTGVFANAGGFPPFLVDKNDGKVVELTCPGTFLGAVKRPRFSEKRFSLGPGQALVLYTDGLIEKLGARADQSGFERLKAVLLKAFDPDPEVYYNRIVAEIFSDTKGVSGDDVTIVVMVCR